MYQYIEQQYNNNPNKIALVYNEVIYTYSWLYKNTLKLSNLLYKNKTKTIAFCLFNSPVNILCYLSAWKSKTHSLPINPRFTNYELINVLKEKHSDIIIIENNRIDNNLIQFCKTSNITIKLIDHINPMDGQLWNELNSISITEQAPPSSITNASNLFIYHLTSGSTGKYKIISHSLEQITTYAKNRASDLGYLNNDRILISLSIHHAFAFSYQLLPALIQGITLYIQPKFNPCETVSLIIKHNITSIALLPSMMYFLCLEVINKKIKNNYTLRYPIACGDALPSSFSSLFEKTFNVSIYQGIGMTEVFGYAQNTNKASNLKSTGKLFNSVKVQIRDDNDNILKNGIMGNVYIQNEALPINYQNSTNLLQNGWLKTGDMGYVDEFNNFFFLGRKRNIIIKDGSNISPIEIENIIYKIPDIYQAAVISQKHKIHGELIIACLVPLLGVNLKKEYIINHCKHYLAEYKIPNKIYFLKELPLNPTGKIDKDTLQKNLNSKLFK